MFSFSLLTYARHSLLPTVRYLWSTLKRRLKSNKGIFGAFSLDSEGKTVSPSFSYCFLFVPLVWMVGAAFPCSRSSFIQWMRALNASAEMERGGVGPGWINGWDCGRCPLCSPSTEFRSLFLVICSTNTPHCVKVAQNLKPHFSATWVLIERKTYFP